MNSLPVARALTAFIAKRVTRTATIIALVLLGVGLLFTALLAYFFSGWWWLLLVPFGTLFGIFSALRFFILFIVARIHTEQLSAEQSAALTDFVDKVQALIEARSMPPLMVVAICLKDLLLYRDIPTVKKLIRDSSNLRYDYSELEKLFSR